MPLPSLLTSQVPWLSFSSAMLQAAFYFRALLHTALGCTVYTLQLLLWQLLIERRLPWDKDLLVTHSPSTLFLHSSYTLASRFISSSKTLANPCLDELNGLRCKTCIDMCFPVSLINTALPWKLPANKHSFQQSFSDLIFKYEWAAKIQQALGEYLQHRRKKHNK